MVVRSIIPALLVLTLSGGAWSLTCNDLNLLCPGTHPREVPWTIIQANVPSTDGSAYSWDYTQATPLAAMSNITCEQRSDHLIITSTGVPSNASYVGKFPFNVDTSNSGHNDNPNTISAQTYSWKIPRTPVIKSSAPVQNTATNGELQYGPVGFALDGVPFFNPFNAQMEDAVQPGAGFEVMDLCFGHPTQRGAYHHHFILHKANCLFQDTPGQHSPKIGYAFDGIPIYGPQSDNGTAPTDLDVCNGRTHPTLGYIYHTTNLVYPYTFGCYRYQTIRQRMIQGTLQATDTNTGTQGTLCSSAIGQRAGTPGSGTTGATPRPASGTQAVGATVTSMSHAPASRRANACLLVSASFVAVMLARWLAL